MDRRFFALRTCRREPGPAEVRINVEAIGLNRAEAMFRSGQYLEPAKMPARIGYEAAGRIDAVGAAVEGFRPGDAVSVIPAFSMNEHGVYGEQAVVPARAVVKTPPGIPAIEAAALWMQYLTAYGALIDIGGLASSGFHYHTGCLQQRRPSRHPDRANGRRHADRDHPHQRQKQALLDAGAELVIATAEEDLEAEVKRITGGRGARIAFDPVAGPYVETLAAATARGGTIFLYGILNMQPTPFPLFQALSSGLTLRGYTLFEITGDAERLARGVAFVERGLAEGALKPKIRQGVPLSTRSSRRTATWSRTSRSAKSSSRCRTYGAQQGWIASLATTDDEDGAGFSPPRHRKQTGERGDPEPARSISVCSAGSPSRLHRSDMKLSGALVCRSARPAVEPRRVFQRGCRASTVSSSKGRPISCRPSGRPRALKPGGHGDRREAGEAGRHGEDVVQVHGDRIVGLVADRERVRRRRRRQDDVDLLEGLREVAGDQRTSPSAPSDNKRRNSRPTEHTCRSGCAAAPRRQTLRRGCSGTSRRAWRPPRAGRSVRRRSGPGWRTPPPAR